MKSLIQLLAVLYIPIFAAIFISPYNIRFYALIYASIFILLMFQKRKSNSYFINQIGFFYKFSIVFLILATFQEFIHGTGLKLIIRQSLSFVIVIGIILFLSKYKKEELIKLLERVFYLIGIMFILQFILSAYESINNIYFVKDFNWALPKDMSASIELRFFLRIFNLDTSLSNTFIHPFSGLLGQHNYWAVQLPFYNLIFLLMYYKTKKNYYLFLIILVFIAILLNTTRVAIFTILITDIIYVLFVKKRKTFSYHLISFSAVFLIAYLFSKLAVNFLQYFDQTDTITGRIEWYTVFYKHIFTSEFPLFIGYGRNELEQIMTNLRAYNFESAFFSIMYANGIIGLSFFIIFLVKIITQGRGSSFINKYFNYLIVFNILGVSLTIGGVITFYAFQFVALIYIYNVITDPSYNETRAVQTTFSKNNLSYKLKPGVLHN